MSSSLVDILLHLVGVSREHENTVYGSRFPHSLPRTREEKILHDYVQRVFRFTWLSKEVSMGGLGASFPVVALVASNV